MITLNLTYEEAVMIDDLLSDEAHEKVKMGMNPDEAWLLYELLEDRLIGDYGKDVVIALDSEEMDYITSLVTDATKKIKIYMGEPIFDLEEKLEGALK